MKHEAKFTIEFRHWLKENPFISSAAFELKYTLTDSLAFIAVRPHQRDALLAAKHNSILYKAPDDSMGMKPFDLFYLVKSQAFVVIRYPEFFCLIDIDEFLKEERQSERRSLTSERARSIAILSVYV